MSGAAFGVVLANMLNGPCALRTTGVPNSDTKSWTANGAFPAGPVSDTLRREGILHCNMMQR